MQYSTIGYHTCRNQGGFAHVQKNAPFKADEDPFLGLGYYFWEYNEEDAHIWGKSKRRYPNGYAICKCQLALENLLDLTQPPDINELLALEHEMMECGRIDERLPVGQLIEWFRDLDDISVFPYDSVRIRQEPPKYELEQRVYASSKPFHNLTLNPQFIICTFYNGPSTIKSRSIVYPKPYQFN